MNSTDAFLNSDAPLIDVRSEGEYADSHISGAFNIPLLNDAHRIKVGTVYKQQGKEAAMQLGFKLVNPLRDSLLQAMRNFTDSDSIRLYCARGGLRSFHMADFYRENGYNVQVLHGGYKAYRNHVMDTIASYRNIIILSGYTGSGKTEILNAMKNMGAQVLDLEHLARHKGSAFGALGYDAQPTSAAFHNLIFDALRAMDKNQPVWIENESHTIGKVFLPPVLWENMKASPGVELSLPLDERVRFTLSRYGNFDIRALQGCVNNLRRRLGDEDTTTMCRLIEAGELDTVVRRLFRYYDKAYEHGREKRNCHNYVRIYFDNLDSEEIARILIKTEYH